MMKTLVQLLLGVLLCVDAGAEHYDVYVLAGQSNMDGRGRAIELSEAQRAPSPNAIIFYRNELASSDGWRPLSTGFSIPPKHKTGVPSPTFGPEIGFASAMEQIMGEASAPTFKLAIIKGSRGGTNLREDWDPGVHGDPKSQGPQYRDMIESIDLAKAELERRGDTFTIAALLWHQGESDSRSTAQRHRERLTELITRFREDLHNDALPIVLGQVHDNSKRDSVRQAIASVVDVGTNMALVSAEGLTTWDEGTHFDASSQLEMGKRFAEQVMKIQAIQGKSGPAKVVCFGDSITNRGYPAILGEMLDVQAINAGVGGNSTGDAMRRLQKDVLDQEPDVTVIFFGTNDARVDNVKKHVPSERYRDNLRTMIESCREVGSKVVVCTLPPIDHEPYFTRHDKKIFDDAGGLHRLVLGYQKSAREVAESSNAPLVDLQELLSQDPAWMSSDGVHPSSAGNRIIAEHIASAVRPLLPIEFNKEPLSE